MVLAQPSSLFGGFNMDNNINRTNPSRMDLEPLSTDLSSNN